MRKLFLSIALLFAAVSCATVQPTGAERHTPLLDAPYYTLRTACLVWTPNLDAYQTTAEQQCGKSHTYAQDLSVWDYGDCGQDVGGTQLYSYVLRFRCVGAEHLGK
jgi:hypothetical protein